MANYLRNMQAMSVAWAYNSTTSAFRCESITVNQDIIENTGAENYIGQFQPDFALVAGRYATVSFSIPFRGSSVADLAPPEGVLLQACGMNAASSGTTPNIVWTFTGAPTANPHLTTESPAGDTTPIDLIVNTDRFQGTLVNCVGNCVFVFEAGKAPMMEFTFMGQVDSSIASNSLSPYEEANHATYVQGSTAVPFQNASITFTPDGGSAEGTLQIPAFRYDLGNKVERTQEGDGTFGEGQPYITGYNPVITVEAYTDLIATFPWESYAPSRQIIDLAFTQNPGAGLREEADIACGFIPITTVPGSRNGRRTTIATCHQEVAGSPTAFSIAWQAS